MLIKSDNIFRNEALLFQRQRLAGSIYVQAASGLRMAIGAFFFGVVLIYALLSTWAVPVRIQVPCVLASPSALIVRPGTNGAEQPGLTWRTIGLASDGRAASAIVARSRLPNGSIRYDAARPLAAANERLAKCLVRVEAGLRPLALALHQARRAS